MATFSKNQVIEQGSLQKFATWAECYKVYQLPNGHDFIAIRSERDEQAMFGSQHCKGAILVWQQGRSISFDWGSLAAPKTEQPEPKAPEIVKDGSQSGEPGTKKQKLLQAVALLWKIRAERKNETTAQADPSFWAFLDESHLEMELKQGLATLNDAERARVQAVLDGKVEPKTPEVVVKPAVQMEQPKIKDLVFIMENDKDWMKQLDAAEALARRNDPRGLDYLKKSLKSSNADRREVAKEIISGLDGDGSTSQNVNLEVVPAKNMRQRILEIILGLILAGAGVGMTYAASSGQDMGGMSSLIPLALIVIGGILLYRGFSGKG